MTPLESIEATAYRVLRRAQLVVAAHHASVDLFRASEAERAALLEPFDQQLHEGAEILADCIREAHRLGTQEQVQAYHRTAVKVYDGHDMLDEAMVYAGQEDES